MDGLFENFLALIPIAAFIAFRIIMAGKKQRKVRREQNAGPSVKETQPAVTVIYREEDEEPVFSAWNLSANDPPPPKPARQTPQPLAVIPPALIEPDTPAPEPFVTQEKSALATKSGPLEPRRRASRFPENLAYLPPLKQALVLAEILGPPKGWNSFKN
jgi:hypothetical protein